MKIARFATNTGPRHAEYDAAQWHILDGEIGSHLRRTGDIMPADSKMLAPCEPRVVVGMAHNWLPDGRDFAAQAFLKSARTVIGPGEEIVLDPTLGLLNVEAELAIVIGCTARHLTRENALRAVFGFTIGNDVTAPDQSPIDELLLQSKNGDGYTPLGPWIETELDGFDSLEMRVLLDGELAASGNTADLANLVIDQLVHVTRYLTLGAGDVILGGCPGSLAAVESGHSVRLEIEGLGALENRVHTAATATEAEAEAEKETTNAAHR